MFSSLFCKLLKSIPRSIVHYIPKIATSTYAKQLSISKYVCLVYICKVSLFCKLHSQDSYQYICMATNVSVVIFQASLCLLFMFMVHRLKFPSVFIIYQTAIIMVLDVTLLVGRVGQERLYCSSSSLQQSYEEPTAYCILTGLTP